jgi:hypothetical protein
MTRALLAEAGWKDTGKGCEHGGASGDVEQRA